MDRPTLIKHSHFDLQEFKGATFLLVFQLKGKSIGRLELRGKKLCFRGDTSKSAKMFFNRLKIFVEEHIKRNLEKKGIKS